MTDEQKDEARGIIARLINILNLSEFEWDADDVRRAISRYEESQTNDE